MVFQMVKSIFREPGTDVLSLDSIDRTIQHLSIIQRKPFLRKLYLDWYREIGQNLALTAPLPTVELGSGGGFIRQVMPNVITSEVLKIPNVDVIFDGLELPFKPGSIHAIVMVDVFHHLRQPGTFLSQAARCIPAGGILCMIEPWRSTWSDWVYRHLHHEPWEPNAPTWELPSGGPLSQANGAMPWIVFSRDRHRFERCHPEWKLHKIRPHTPFRYLLSGGVSFRTPMPAWSFELATKMEKGLNRMMHHMAMFATITLVRRS
jgi:SAM-dependent methyltransferase